MTEDVQQTRLQSYLDAEKKALQAQSYSVNGHSVTRPGIDALGQGIDALLGATTGGRSRRIILRDD